MSECSIDSSEYVPPRRWNRSDLLSNSERKYSLGDSARREFAPWRLEGNSNSSDSNSSSVDLPSEISLRQLWRAERITRPERDIISSLAEIFLHVVILRRSRRHQREKYPVRKPTLLLVKRKTTPSRKNFSLGIRNITGENNRVERVR